MGGGPCHLHWNQKKVAIVCDIKGLYSSYDIAVTIPVPWGHVAGKAWGDPTGKPVLALHGMLALVGLWWYLYGHSCRLA